MILVVVGVLVAHEYFYSLVGDSLADVLNPIRKLLLGIEKVGDVHSHVRVCDR